MVSIPGYYYKLKLSLGMKVAIVGCGSGESIDLIYKKIGKDGELLCLDINQEQISLTKRKLCSQNIFNVKYHVADIQNYQGKEKYDLVYCRFLLIHLMNPQRALNNMLSLLKPGGIIACEEHDYKTMFNYPYSYSIDKYKELLKEIEQKLNVDYSYGTKLFHTLCHLNLKKVKYHFYLPVFNNAEKKLLLKLSLLETREYFIKHHLVNNLEIDNMFNEIEDFIKDRTVIQSTGGVFQSWGIK
ncbi:MAG: class I SAM-dependent methyltransferase [Rickettsia conorii subsp. raoultii]|uniref:class I SAM-dependent methyltransferase n=1 Tax=Rickettsia conorii TaxID=781 RepID=UPI003AF1B2D9